jgi:GxxExxY protein
MMQETSDPFSYTVIGKAMQVHRELGPGVDEVFYQELLSVRLSEAGVVHERRVRRSLVHRGFTADIFEADLLFPDRMVEELKCLGGGFDPEHYVQLFCYLKFWNLPTGLLLDFAKDSLMRRRVNYTPAKLPPCLPATLLEDSPNLASDHELGFALCRAASRIISEYGGGYRDTTYRGLLTADLSADRISCAPTPVAPVRAAGLLLGETRCDCLNVAGRFGVLVLALKDTVTATDIATLRTYLRLLELPHGLVLNFAKERLDHVWIRSRPT